MAQSRQCAHGASPALLISPLAIQSRACLPFSTLFLAMASRHGHAGYVMTQWNTSDFDEAGRALGHDIHTQTCLPRQLNWPRPVMEGFEMAAHQGLRRQSADRFVGKWLQLRLNAWKRGRIVAADVTPDLLRQIDVTHCPVLRVRLTHGTLQESDWSVDRLNNDGAYAASNLAVMSVKANRAKGTLSFDEVHARVKQGRDGGGLSCLEWQRMASLMLGPAYALRQHEAPRLPLCAPLPCRAVRLAYQQIQRLLTEGCARQAGKNQMLRAFYPACGHESARFKLEALVHQVHEGLKLIPSHDERWDVWLQGGVMDAFERWLDSLGEADLLRAAAISGYLSQARPETPERLRAWHLPTRGYSPQLC